MSFIRQSLVTFRDEKSTGIDKISDGRLIYVNSFMRFFIKYNSINLTSSTNIDTAIINKNIVELGTRYYNPFSKALIYAGKNSNKVTLLSNTCVLTQSETTAGTARNDFTGAFVYNKALFYGGSNTTYSIRYNLVTILTKTGNLAQAESNIGTARTIPVGVSFFNKALFYAGYNGAMYNVGSNITTLLNDIGVTLQAEGTAGTTKDYNAGATIWDPITKKNYGLYYAGRCTVAINLITIIDESAIIKGTESSIGTIKMRLAGASSNMDAMFFGGVDSYSSPLNTLSIITANSTLKQSESNISTIRERASGANVGYNVIFYGGSGSVNYNVSSLVSPSGILVQNDVFVGSERLNTAASSL